MRVLAARRFPGSAWDELRDVEFMPPEGVAEPRPGIEALVVANEPVDERLLDLLPGLRLVANYGVGYDRIDVAACAWRGVAVTNTPGVLDAATADLTMALLLAARRRVVEGDRFVRAGRWQEGWAYPYLVGDEVAGATLGIVGLGRIGTAVARRARGFDMRLLYAKRDRLDAARERELGVEHRELDALLGEADVVTLHVPRSAETDRLVDARRLALLRDGACLVNTARGEIVDEPALVRELVSGRIRAGLDVFAKEPHVPSELLELPNVVLTPHLGSATTSTRAAMTRVVVDNILAAEAGRPLVTPVPGASGSEPQSPV
jgi:lactate dehydrogenase-like 2-hydroxyacid dehydrogenase